MKKFLNLLTMVVLLALPTVLVSCSDDDDSGITGTYISTNGTDELVLNPNGTCSFASSGYAYTGNGTYTVEADDVVIITIYDSNSDTTTVLKGYIDGNTITLYDDEGNVIGSFIKQSGGDSANNSSIVGTWTYSETINYGGYQEKYTQYVNFDSDGSLTSVEIEEGYSPYVEYGIWKLNGKELSIEFGDYGEKHIYRIEKISSNSMTLSRKNEGRTEYLTMTRCSYSEMEKYL